MAFNMSVNIKDVAKKSGVSTATVSHVINGTRFVSDVTKQKVQKAMVVLNYHPNLIARSLRCKKSKTIGLIVPTVNEGAPDFFYMSVAQGIQHYIKKQGYHLIFSNYNNECDEEEQIQVFNTKCIDGLILAPTNDLREKVRNHTLFGDYPIVYVDRKMRNQPGDTILIDNQEGVFEAIQHMIHKGHTRIGFISAERGENTSDEHFQGYLKALSKYGISIDSNLIKSGPSNFETGVQLTRELLESQKVTALFIANNTLTMGAIHYLQHKNIDIPNDLAVIGYDDYEWTKVTTPFLSVIKQPAFEVGEKAAEILLSKINKQNSDYHDYRLKPYFISRESC